MSVPSPKPRILDVLDTLGAAIETVLNAQAPSIPINAGPGTVIATQIAKIVAKKAGNSAIALWPLPEIDCTRFSADEGQRAIPPDITLQASIGIDSTAGVQDSGIGAYDSGVGAFDLLNGPAAGGIEITFSGTSMACYVHTIIDNEGDALVEPTGSQTLQQVAANVAAAVSALNLPGVTATANDVVVLITGAQKVVCNIVALGQLQRTVAQMRRPIQASIYSPDPTTRSVIFDILRSYIGQSDSHWFVMSDGQDLYIDFGHDSGMIEKAQSTYKAFEYHMVFEAEYPITILQSASQLAVVENEITENAYAPVTVYSG